VLARWQPPGVPARSGLVLAPAGTPKGSTVPSWVDGPGAVTDPPADPRDVVAGVCIAVALTCLASLLVQLGGQTLARRALDRRRLIAWDAEWRTVGPLWSGHRNWGTASPPDQQHPQPLGILTHLQVLAGIRFLGRRAHLKRLPDRVRAAHGVGNGGVDRRQRRGVGSNPVLPFSFRTDGTSPT
jgi:hypothetical protein